MGAEPVLLDVEGGVATITLNRPENRNSMTPELLQGFRACVERVRGDAGVRVVVVTGTGRSFCAGADFRAGAAGGPGGLPVQRAFATYEPFLSVFDLEVPSVAALNGHAIGGGLGLALVCDLRIASREAKLGANFARLGFHSGMAISYLLPRIVGVPAAADLLFTGRLLSGAEAGAIGLVHQAVEPERVAEAARAKAAAIAAAAPLAVRLLKRSLYAEAGWNPRDAAWREAFAQSATLASEDAREGIRALLEKREPRFQGR